VSSKKFKNSVCVYCATSLAVTADHVFARAFFPVERRDNLPKVPACQGCNKTKSDLEHYLSTVLLLGGQHQDARPHMLDALPGRLAKNPRVQRQILEGIRLGPHEATPGVVVPGMLIPFDGQKLHDWVAYVAKALLWHHWKVVLSPEHMGYVASLTSTGQNAFAPVLNKYAQHVAGDNLGNGTFIYQGVQGAEYPEFSLWGFSVYGGLPTLGREGKAGSRSMFLAAFTGDKSLFNKSDLAWFLETAPDVSQTAP
jgi:hypothetical protein